MSRLGRLLVGGLVVLVGLSWWYTRYQSDQLAVWRQRSEDGLALAEVWRLRSDSLALVQHVQVKTVTKILVRVDTLRLQSETLLVHGDTAAGLADLREGFGLCMAATDTLMLAVSLCEQRVQLERRRGDSLQALLREGLKVSRPRRWGCTVGLGAVEGIGHGLGAAVVCGRHF
jgi:hypothetical protein